MNRSIRVCALIGLLSTFLLFVAIWPAWQMLPPLSPLLTAAEVAQHFRDHRIGIMLGGVIVTLAGSLYFVFLGGLFACTRRMESAGSPLSNAAVMVAVFGFMPLFLLAVFFIEAVYRPELSDDTVRLLFDLGVYMLVFPAMPALVLYGVVGFAVIGDVNAAPIFPRWIGYLSFWVAALSAPGCILPFVKSGPFAWNGLFSFWVPAIVFGIWIVVVVWAMWRGARHPALTAARARAL
ncbi:hypothetical protein [Solimonas soli]|jgi:hypothetical protein|uniref:hypothetical protein n=1 Tax=Solimonas soli TaxID=413479 RepID=UPI0004B7CDF9|nr:hypothetical protein [Solimonas soli]